MFDEVTRKEGAKRAVRRAGFLLGSTVFQGVVLLAIVLASALVKTRVASESQTVDVRFVRSAPVARRAPTAPFAPPPPRRPHVAKPKTALAKPPPMQAMVQPKQIQPEMKPPDPNEPKEPEYDWGEGGEGVVGGVVGGSGQAPAPAPVPGPPTYATLRDTKPRPAEEGCVQNAIRLSNELLDVAGNSTIRVKFVIRSDGTPASFETMTQNVDQRLADAIWSAIQGCRWLAGADPQGRPKTFLVSLPLRFRAE